VSNSVKKNSIDAKDVYYANSLEYLSAELEKLDLLLKYHFEKEISRGVFSRDNIPADIFVSASQIENLLKKKDGGIEPDEIFESLLLEIQNKEKEILNKSRVSREKGVYLPFDILQQLFNLGYHEIQILIIALAPVIDSKYERIYAYFNDSMASRLPAVQMIYDLFCHDYQDIANMNFLFSGYGALTYWNLIHFSGDQNYKAASRTFFIDRRIGDFLLGGNILDTPFPRSVYFIRNDDFAAEKLPGDISRRVNVLTEGNLNEGDPLRILCTGESRRTKLKTAALMAGKSGCSLLYINATEVANSETGLFPGTLLPRTLLREALLFHSAVYLDFEDMVEAELPEKLKMFLDEFEMLPGLLFICIGRDKQQKQLGGSGRFFEIHFGIPERRERVDIWNSYIGASFKVNGVGLEHMVDRFLFTEEQIENAVVVAKKNSLLRGSVGGNGRSNGQTGVELTMADLIQGCQSQCSTNLSSMGVKLQYGYTLDDIVLPPDRVEHLKEIVNQYMNRIQVLHQWGFSRKISYGKGLCVLFSGPSGTGKTMAASIIAKELKLDVFKIDLSSIVSKYIGETEKNLAKIFTEASISNAILFFDEADALFGKRSEVKDAHDRYANIETSYLLQKMEEYEGITILASNFRQNMDNAFLRRINFIVEFPFPDKSLRKILWQKIFPENAPVDPGIDYGFLSEKMEMTGGSIKNMALAAAYMASAQSEPIEMTHIIKAARREYQKLGKPFIVSEFLPYSEFLEVKKTGVT